MVFTLGAVTGSANPNGVPGELVPLEVRQAIFQDLPDQSILLNAPGINRIPLTLNGAAFPVSTTQPVANWVGETEIKPKSSFGLSALTMRPHKVAVIVPVSQELTQSNPAGVLELLRAQLPAAIALAFDRAAFHGTGPFQTDFTNVTKEVALGGTSGSAANKGGVYADLVKGMQEVAKDGYDLTGFLGDKIVKPELLLSVDVNGRPLLLADANGSTAQVGGGTILGETATLGKGVAAGTTFRLIGGDLSTIYVGVANDITIDVDNAASYTGPDGTMRSAYERNEVLFRAEASFGLLVTQPKALVRYTSGGAYVAPSAGGGSFSGPVGTSGGSGN